MKKIIIAFILLFTIFIFTSSYKLMDDESKYDLILENNKLKKEYIKLDNKINNLKNKLDSINNYNKYINTKILGLDPDTFYIEKIIDGSLDSTSLEIDTGSLNNQIMQLNDIFMLILDECKDTYIFSKQNKFLYDAYPNMSPVRKMINLTSNKSKFGLRMHPIHSRYIFHDGIDISVPMGTKIYSTMNGFAEVIYSCSGYGNHIRIKNGFGYETLYAHLNKEIYIKDGDYVEKGQLIARSGNTGLSTAPHLHYGIKINNKYYNPLNFIFEYKINGKTINNLNITK